MNTNRVSLAALDKMTKEQVNALPLDQIALLLEDLADLKANVKGLDSVLSATMHHRFAERAAALRQAVGKDTGTVRVEEGEFIVISDLPKRVEWDQQKLAVAVKEIEEWGEPVADFVTTEYKVAEAKFTAWPSAISKLFAPARTVGVGKPTFKIERRAA